MRNYQKVDESIWCLLKCAAHNILLAKWRCGSLHNARRWSKNADQIFMCLYYSLWLPLKSNLSYSYRYTYLFSKISIWKHWLGFVFRMWTIKSIYFVVKFIGTTNTATKYIYVNDYTESIAHTQSLTLRMNVNQCERQPCTSNAHKTLWKVRNARISARARSFAHFIATNGRHRKP